MEERTPRPNQLPQTLLRCVFVFKAEEAKRGSELIYFSLLIVRHNLINSILHPPEDYGRGLLTPPSGSYKAGNVANKSCFRTRCLQEVSRLRGLPLCLQEASRLQGLPVCPAAGAAWVATMEGLGTLWRRFGCGERVPVPGQYPCTLTPTGAMVPLQRQVSAQGPPTLVAGFPLPRLVPSFPHPVKSSQALDMGSQMPGAQSCA